MAINLSPVDSLSGLSLIFSEAPLLVATIEVNYL